MAWIPPQFFNFSSWFPPLLPRTCWAHAAALEQSNSCANGSLKARRVKSRHVITAAAPQFRGFLTDFNRTKKKKRRRRYKNFPIPPRRWGEWGCGKKDSLQICSRLLPRDWRHMLGHGYFYFVMYIITATVVLLWKLFVQVGARMKHHVSQSLMWGCDRLSLRSFKSLCVGGWQEVVYICWYSWWQKC